MATIMEDDEYAHMKPGCHHGQREREPVGYRQAPVHQAIEDAYGTSVFTTCQTLRPIEGVWRDHHLLPALEAGRGSLAVQAKSWPAWFELAGDVGDRSTADSTFWTDLFTT